MKVTLDQLKKLLASYKLKVLRVQPMDHGYFIETNRGKKILTIWENADLLKWSNGWREELFTQGHEQVERFLINSNKKKYIRYQGKYFVLTDASEAEALNPQSIDMCKKAGEIFANLHLVLDRMDQKITLVSSKEVDEDFFSRGSTAIKQMIPVIEMKESPTIVDELMYANLPSLYKRFRRAHQLWEGIKDSISYLPPSFSQFKLNQLARKGKECFVSGAYNQSVTTMHQDTVQLIREIYEKSDWSLTSVSSFLDGYEKQRKLTDQELVFLLVQLIVPQEVWNHFLTYLTSQSLTDDQAERFVEDIQRQHYWDHLTIFIGRIIDQRNQATA